MIVQVTSIQGEKFTVNTNLISEIMPRGKDYLVHIQGGIYITLSAEEAEKIMPQGGTTK